MFVNTINDKIIQYPVLEQLKKLLILKGSSQATICNYLCGVARFLDYIEYDNSFQITVDMFQDYLFFLHSTELKKNSINNNNSYIRFFFQAVLDIPINTHRVPMAATSHKEIFFLFDHHIESLLRSTQHDSKFDCIIKLGLCCGLRINEVASLMTCDIHTRDINNTGIFIRDSKRNKSRFVPLDNTSYKAIQKYAKEYRIQPGTREYFFRFRNNGKKVTTNTLRYYFNKYRDAAGIPSDCTFHCLRHTYAVSFLRNNGDVIDLRYRLGHGSLGSTNAYLHFSKNMMKFHPSHIDLLLKGGLDNDK